MNLLKNIGKTVLAALLVLCISGFPPVYSADKSPAADTAKKAPKIQFDEKQHDFGKHPQNAKLKHTFTFKNTGEDTLFIEKVKAG